MILLRGRIGRAQKSVLIGGEEASIPLHFGWLGGGGGCHNALRKQGEKESCPDPSLDPSPIITAFLSPSKSLKLSIILSLSHRGR